jgi:hypothetical protein
MGETPGKKPQKFPAALACVDGVVGKTAAGRVDFSVCLDFVCLSVCVCAVCGGVCDVACRSICSIVRKRSQRKCTEAAGRTNNQCNYGRQIVFVSNGFTRFVYLIRFKKKITIHLQQFFSFPFFYSLSHSIFDHFIDPFFFLSPPVTGFTLGTFSFCFVRRPY